MATERKKQDRSQSLTTQPTREFQDLFLKEYVKHGAVKHAAEAVGVSRETVRQWINEDMYGFAQRMADARADYADSVRKMIRDRLENPDGKKKIGTDYLLVRHAEAVCPEYRRNITVQHEGGERLMAVLAKLQEQQEKEADRLEDGERPALVEGQIRGLEQLPVVEEGQEWNGRYGDELGQPGRPWTE